MPPARDFPIYRSALRSGREQRAARRLFIAADQRFADSRAARLLDVAVVAAIASHLPFMQHDWSDKGLNYPQETTLS